MSVLYDEQPETSQEYLLKNLMHVRPVLHLKGRFWCLDVHICAGPVMSAMIVATWWCWGSGDVRGDISFLLSGGDGIFFSCER